MTNKALIDALEKIAAQENTNPELTKHDLIQWARQALADASIGRADALDPATVTQRREAEGLSIRALGDLTGISFSTLARFERGEGSLNIENRAALRDWLSLPDRRSIHPQAPAQPIGGEDVRERIKDVLLNYPGRVGFKLKTREVDDLTNKILAALSATPAQADDYKFWECVAKGIMDEWPNAGKKRTIGQTIDDMIGAAKATLKEQGIYATPQSGWRDDMENAPRDGLKVDLIINGLFRLPDCKWGKEEPHREATWLNYRPHPDALHDWEWQEITSNTDEVTHWMKPLPIPPLPNPQNSEVSDG